MYNRNNEIKLNDDIAITSLLLQKMGIFNQNSNGAAEVFKQSIGARNRLRMGLSYIAGRN
jgi:hypothetical protein